jgi:hypothetical protein
MFFRYVLVLILLLFGVTVQAADLSVADGVITTAIESQQPVDRIESFSADYAKLYCFTRIVGAAGDSAVTHVWYYQDNEMARVTLPIRSKDWRTYSSKRFLPNWKGEWRVVVIDEQLNELAVIPFRLD